MNKATQSLSLYHQIVGRGGRITDKIYKPYFKLIDLGGNVSRLGSWSDNVDWEDIYNDEKEKKTAIRDLENFKVCHNCDSLIDDYDCEVCGAEKPPKKEKKKIDKIAKEVKKLPSPKSSIILSYAEKKGLDINDAKNLTANYILDMFIFSGTKKITVKENIGYLKSKIRKTITPIYFDLHKSNLKGNRYRSINDFEKKIHKKLNKYYENRS